MSEPDVYFLGRSTAEEARLQRQIADLAPASDAQFDKIGIKQGEHIVDIGCGPGGVLHLLGKRVGPSGSVLGIEQSPHFVRLARQFVASHALDHVEVQEGDAYSTGLPRASFDGAHTRLVLVNVPHPERIIHEMVSLVRPGGWIASFEADYVAHLCDPTIAAWSRLLDAYTTYSAAQGIDLFIGRRVHRLLRAAGVEDLRTDAVLHVYPPGHDRRPILYDFIKNVSDQLIDGEYIERSELENDMCELAAHLANPGVLVTSHVFFRTIGRVPH